MSDVEPVDEMVPTIVLAGWALVGAAAAAVAGVLVARGWWRR